MYFCKVCDYGELTPTKRMNELKNKKTKEQAKESKAIESLPTICFTLPQRLLILGRLCFLPTFDPGLSGLF